MISRPTACLPWLLFLLATAACNQSFDAIVESDRYFSVYGVLDATADTQWIRVMPVRDTIFTNPDPQDITVELAKEGSNRTVLLRDSLFHFRSHVPDKVADLYVHTFWTTEPIEPGADYRLTVTAADGRSAFAEVSVPELIDSVTVFISQGNYNHRFGARDYLRVDADELALTQVIHFVPGFEVPTLTVYTGRASQGAIPGTTEMRYLKRYTGFPSDMPPPINVCLEAWPCEIRIVASAERWAYDPLLSDEAIGALDALSNVTNGVGFIGGIVQKRVPYERCVWKATVPIDGGPRYCELTYGPRSATLSGAVRDFHCAGKPLEDGVVELTEVEGLYIRTASGRYTEGSYSIGALNGGLYEYRVMATADFFEEEGTLLLVPAQAQTKDFVLRRKSNNCPPPGL